jgi:hypothetical protein
MFIENPTLKKQQAPSGGMMFGDFRRPMHMPLLTELVKEVVHLFL